MKRLERAISGSDGSEYVLRVCLGVVTLEQNLFFGMWFDMAEDLVRDVAHIVTVLVFEDDPAFVLPEIEAVHVLVSVSRFEHDLHGQ